MSFSVVNVCLGSIRCASRTKRSAYVVLGFAALDPPETLIDLIAFEGEPLPPSLADVPAQRVAFAPASDAPVTDQTSSA